MMFHVGRKIILRLFTVCINIIYHDDDDDDFTRVFRVSFIDSDKCQNYEIIRHRKERETEEKRNILIRFNCEL